MSAKVSFGNVNGHTNPVPHVSLSTSRKRTNSTNILLTPMASSLTDVGGVKQRHGSFTEVGGVKQQHSQAGNVASTVDDLPDLDDGNSITK